MDLIALSRNIKQLKLKLNQCFYSRKRAMDSKLLLFKFYGNKNMSKVE